jgi:hypothetical protein
LLALYFFLWWPLLTAKLPFQGYKLQKYLKKSMNRHTFDQERCALLLQYKAGDTSGFDELPPSTRYKLVRLADQLDACSGKLFFEGLEVVPQEQVQAALQAVYDNPATSKNGIHSLFNTVKKLYVGISQRDCAAFLKNQEAHQLLLVPQRHKTIKSIVPSKVLQHMQVDLVDVSGLAPQNKGWTFLLTAIDLFSKYAFVVPLKRKTEDQVTAAMQHVLDSGGRPRLLQSDNGAEFKNALFSDLCARYGVKQLFSLPHSPQSQGAVERFNRTLKAAIHHYLVQHSTRAYHSVLQTLVDSYNASVHAVVKEPPIDIFQGRVEAEKVKRRIQAQAVQSPAAQVLHKGDMVRLKIPKALLEKKYTQNWTRELFTVVQVHRHPPQNSYSIADVDGHRHPKPYYADSLQFVDVDKLVPVRSHTPPTTHRVERAGPTVEEGEPYVWIPLPPEQRERRPNVRLQDH